MVLHSRRNALLASSVLLMAGALGLALPQVIGPSTRGTQVLQLHVEDGRAGASGTTRDGRKFRCTGTSVEVARWLSDLGIRVEALGDSTDVTRFIHLEEVKRG
ncbi:MAG TPA: hypothetical protein VEI97_20095 [bacterium]|nr:hypothetical protein [bacterium]